MNLECTKTLLKNIFDGYSGDKNDLVRAMNDLYTESQHQPVPDEILVQAAGAEESKNFSDDGREAVKEMMEHLDGKYYITPHTEKGEKESYFRISKDAAIPRNRLISQYPAAKTVIIENHDTEARNDFGLITTENCKYSDVGSNIIEKWAGFGRTLIRKQYNFKGTNIVQTLSIIDKLLS